MIAIRDRLGDRAGSAAWWTVLGISDKAQATAQKLQVAFGRLYEIDVTMTQRAGVVLRPQLRELEDLRDDLSDEIRKLSGRGSASRPD